MMFKKKIAFALIPVFVLTAAPAATAAIVRYESSYIFSTGGLSPLVGPDGGIGEFRSVRPTSIAPLPLTEMYLFDPVPRSSLHHGYINFEFDTETGAVNNYLIDFGDNRGRSQGTVTVKTGTIHEASYDVEDLILRPPAANQEFLFPTAELIPAQGGEPARTRIRFVGASRDFDTFGFLLEVEADLFALDTDSQVEISPFRPDAPIPLSSGHRTPSELLGTDELNLLQPLSPLFDDDRTGTFGVRTHRSQMNDIIGPTAGDLGARGGIFLFGTVIQPDPIPVPEPSSLALLAGAGLLMMGRRRRHNARVKNM